MSRLNSKNRSTTARLSLVLVVGFSIATVACEEQTGRLFTYGGEPVHPACIHALTMHQGDVLPVTTAVSLQGCSASERSHSKIRYEGEILTFEDDVLLGGGSFGYREIAQLENGIYGLVIRRVLPNGEERVSLAAVDVVSRPMLRNGRILTMEMIELLGELWIPGMDTLTFRSVGNSVSFVAGVGPERVERDVDLTRLGKLRK